MFFASRDALNSSSEFSMCIRACTPKTDAAQHTGHVASIARAARTAWTSAFRFCLDESFQWPCSSSGLSAGAGAGFAGCAVPLRIFQTVAWYVCLH
jgi:hypothetical protein